MASANFPTLTSELCLSPGRTSAHRALAERDGNGKLVVWDAFIIAPLGNNTTLVDFSVFGKFLSGCIKCDIALESRIIVYTFFSKGLFVLIRWFIHAFFVA
jgi:hypothetical protein